MKINNIRTFLPSIDFEISKQFYIDLGFSIMWQDEKMALFGTNNYSFFLQKYYNKDWAENLMIQLFVEDLDELYQVCERLMSNYDGLKLKPIFSANYGRTFHLIDPAGVLWHMTESVVQDMDSSKLLCEDN